MQAFGLDRALCQQVVEGLKRMRLDHQYRFSAGLIRIHDRLREERLSARMLLQVHDELVFEVPGPEKDAVGTLVRAEMEGAASLSVPLVVDIGVGRNWLETKIG